MLRLFDTSEGEAIEIFAFENEGAVVDTALYTEYSYHYLKTEIKAIPECGDPPVTLDEALESLTHPYHRWELADHDGTIIKNN